MDGAAPGHALKVQHGKRAIDVTVPENATVQDLKALLRPLTGQLERNMKLICRAQVLNPDSVRLSALGVKGGDKLMLLAGAAGPAPLKDTQPVSIQKSAPVATVQKPSSLPAGDQWASRVAGWAATGVVALRDAGLASLPESVVASCTNATVLDLHNNRLQATPPQLVHFTRCTRLTLSSCELTEVDFSVLPAALQQLSLENNLLTALPETLNRLNALRKLSVSRNRLRTLPSTIALPALVLLDASHNQLQAVADLDACVALEEVRLENNQIACLPTGLGALPRLAVLVLDSNLVDVAHVPPKLLQAPSLHTLSLHNNPVTIDQLRQLEGWPAFDARRQSRVGKQIAGGVLGTGGGLDEGSDAVMRSRHGK